jgi:RimJ/RimL family protein N-acetyltransferase
MNGMPGVPNIPSLTDGIVVLRAPVEEDIEGAYEQCQDPVSQRWTNIAVPYTRDDARRYLRHLIPGGWETDHEWGFAVEARDDAGVPRFAGTVSLRNEGDGRAEIAYGAHPWVRGRGVMERALRLLLDWGFAERGLQTVIWLARRGNWASRRVAWKLGFSIDGTLRDWLAQREVLVDAWAGTLRRGEHMAPRNEWLLPARIFDGSLVLRAGVDSDIPRMVEGFNDPLVQRYSQSIREEAPYDEASVRERELRHLEEGARGCSVAWAVADPVTDEFLGSVTIFDIQPGREAEIGYWAHPDARGRGLMTRACRMAVRHAFIDAEDGGLGLHRLRACAADGNLASQRVLEGSGFIRFGVERRSTLLPDGSYVDTAAFDQLAGEYGR